MSTDLLNPCIPLRLRYATGEEERLVDRECYSDVVLECGGTEAERARLARLFEQMGQCDAAHVIPAGVYLEE